MKKVLVFSGTSDGRELSGRLSREGFSVAVSVATDYGREEQGEIPGVSVLTGRLDKDAMIKLLGEYDAVCDATHPYAVEVSENIKSAAKAVNKPYFRLVRELVGPYEAKSGIVSAAGREEASEALLLLEKEAPAASGGELRAWNIMLTTGSKDLSFYAGRLGVERLFPRVLPSVESIKLCEAAGIPKRNIIAMQGPFSEELNIALIRQYSIDALLTKDSGSAGGFPEKLAAVEKTGARCVVIRRPEDEGCTAEEIIEKLRKRESFL